MRKKLFSLMAVLSILFAFTSCESFETNILQIRWGIVDNGVPSAGTSNVYYYAIKDAYEAVNDACKKTGGENYIASSVQGECSINVVERREVETKMAYVVADSKSRIEACQLSSLLSNRTFHIEYRFGNTGDWVQSYEYVYPSK